MFVLRENSDWPSLFHGLEQKFLPVIKVWQNLHRDVSIELLVAREKHFAHAASAERGEDFLGTERLAVFTS